MNSVVFVRSPSNTWGGLSLISLLFSVSVIVSCFLVWLFLVSFLAGWGVEAGFTGSEGRGVGLSSASTSVDLSMGRLSLWCSVVGSFQ